MDTSGEYYKGDCIDISHNGEIFAVGISEYDMTEVEKIKRKHSNEIEGTLGHKVSDEVINTMNLVLNKGKLNERVS